MDGHSSPASSSPPQISTAPSSASKQTTYTTAGTIYNPSSALPLQPPTRRGRSTKWALGSSHPELCLLPKTVLAGLSSKALAGPSSGRSASTLQYTPPQQNYDRAVSPLSEPEHAAINMPLQTIHMRSGTTPEALSLSLFDKNPVHRGKGKETLNPNDSAIFGKDTLSSNEHATPDNNATSNGNDGDARVKAMMNKFNVMSLKNLASYTNPMQDEARNALRLGDVGSGPQSASPLYSERQKTGSSFDEISLLRPAHVDGPTSLDNYRPSLRLLPTARSPSPASSAEADLAAAPTTLATGSGAPRPLTSGPPGQRQYRPSTFESTFKALQPKHQEHLLFEDAHGLVTTHQTPPQTGFEDVDYLPPIIGRAPSGDDMTDEEEPHTLADLVRNSVPDGPPLPKVVSFIATVMEPFVDQTLDMTQAHWRFTSSYSYDRYMPGTTFLTDQMIRARNDRIEEYWYSGSDMLGRRPEQVLRESNYRKLQHSYGVIGDG